MQGVASDKFAIGYSGIGYKTADVRAVPIAAKKGEKCFEADAANSYSGDYAISRFLYVYVNKAPNKPLAPLEAEFVKLVLSQAGQQVVVKDGYIPLPAKVVDKTLADLGLSQAGNVAKK